MINNTSLYYTRVFGYNGANNQLTSVANPSGSVIYSNNMTYDASGNTLTTNADRVYTWNYANQLKTFALLSGGGSVSTFTNYLYDASGARVKKFVLTNSNHYESTVYIDGMFEEYTRASTFGISEHRNYINLPGGLQLKTGALDDPDEGTLYKPKIILRMFIAQFRTIFTSSYLSFEDYFSVLEISFSFLQIFSRNNTCSEAYLSRHWDKRTSTYCFNYLKAFTYVY